jgi:hypothetical protein
MAHKPTAQQVRSVQKVLYKPARMRSINADIQSIAVLMNVDNPGSDSAPPWVVEATGAPDPRIAEVVMRCRRIATAARAAAGELAHLEAVPAADRTKLRRSLTEQAAGWEARADAWEAPGRPDDVEGAAALISSHFAAAATAQRAVKRYFRTDLEGVA